MDLILQADGQTMEWSNRAFVLSIVRIQALGVLEGCIEERLMQATGLMANRSGQIPGLDIWRVETPYQLVSQSGPMTESFSNISSFPFAGGGLRDNAHCISLGDLDLLLAKILPNEVAGYVPSLLWRRDRRLQSPFLRDGAVDSLALRFRSSLPIFSHCVCL